MPHRLFDAILFAAACPDIWLEDGNFHVSYTVGGVHAEFVLPPNTFLKSLRQANRVAAEFTSRDNVLAIEFDSKFERRFHTSDEEKSA